MAATYTTIYLSDMRDLLKEEKGWVMFAPPGSEVYFEYHLKVPNNVCIVVHTSILPQSMEARSCGSDAIRVTLVYTDAVTRTKKGLHKFKRVHRTEGWKDNLTSRVKEAFVYAKTKVPLCPKCGRIMAVRHNKNTGQPFYGCIGYYAVVKPCAYTQKYV